VRRNNSFIEIQKTGSQKILLLKLTFMKFEILNWLIILGAFGQMFTAIIYPYVRHKVFDWHNDIKKLKPLNQEVAKTYGRYIRGLNFSFGLICILFADDLKNQTGLAVASTGLICSLLDRKSNNTVRLLSYVRNSKETYF
jgi:hypothetical protein